MKVKNNQINNSVTYLNYVINVLRFDVMTFLNDTLYSANEISNSGGLNDDKSAKNIIHKSLKSKNSVRDCVALLIFLTDEDFSKEVSLNKIIDTNVKSKYFETESNKKKITVSYIPPEKDILIKCEELILQTVLDNLFNLAYDQVTDSKVIFSASFESGFATVTLQYKGKKHKMMNATIDKSEEREMSSSLTEFNNPYTLMKLMEKIGLGVLSFSNRENYNIINFTLHLIAKESDTPQPGKITTLQEHNWKDKTVLIVDDIEVNYIFLETILADTRVKTLYASNGKIAVDMCRSHPEIDAVLMDIKMPVMDGYEATKIIKEEKPDLPVIIQTAYSFNEEYERCKELGCSDYITKPLKSENVISVLAKYFIE